MNQSNRRCSVKREDLLDNVTEWAEKLKALGDVWGALSWHVERYDGDGDSLARCGEMLGMIIADYAGLIQDTVTENMSSFVGLDKNVVFPLANCQEVYEWSSKHRHDPDICHIDYQLKELTSFIMSAAMPAIRLKNSFEELKKEIIAQHKNAPAAVSAAAGA